MFDAESMAVSKFLDVVTVIEKYLLEISRSVRKKEGVRKTSTSKDFYIGGITKSKVSENYLQINFANGRIVACYVNLTLDTTCWEIDIYFVRDHEHGEERVHDFFDMKVNSIDGLTNALSICLRDLTEYFETHEIQQFII